MSYLVSRLQERLNTAGSTRFKMTWKKRATPQKRSLYQLELRVPSTGAIDYGLLPTPSGTSNHGSSHVSGRIDEWGGSSNPFRGTPIGKIHCVPFELYLMDYSAAWAEQMPLAMQSSRRSRRKS